MALNYTFAILSTGMVCTGMVMDEEVIVVYAFILFIGLIYHYTSKLVDDSIRIESQKIGKEFDLFFDFQKNIVKSLIKYHVLQILIITQIKGLLDFSLSEISNLIQTKKKILDGKLGSQMEQKLSYLASKEQGIAMKVQGDASKQIIANVQKLFSTENKESKKIKEKFLAENISKLDSIG